MMGAMPMGASVRLFPPAEQMGVAEGLETALSASILYNAPVWSTLTEGLMSEWQPPTVAKLIFIFADNDASFAGQAAAYTLAKRLKHKGLDVMVEMPPRVGEDWNDILMKQKGLKP
jgi:putative DNA primase/helicase